MEDTLKISREQLYNEIWETSLTSVSKKYGVPYSAIKKACIESEIPIPPVGYRTKLEFGKTVIKTPLNASQVIEVILPIKSNLNVSQAFEIHSERSTKDVVAKSEDVNSQYPGLLTFLSNNEKEKVLIASKEIKISAENSKLHRKIVAYKNVVNDWNNKDTKEKLAQRSPKNYSKQPPFLAGVISIDALPRVYRILDSLFRQIESLGGTINDDLTLQIRNERVSMEIVENQDVVEHKLTKQEAQELIKYEDDKRRYSWVSKPNFRKYDYVFNGKLKISIRKNKYFKDTDKTSIESMFGNMIIDIYEQSEVVRIERETREEEARKREEEARLKEAKRELFIEEVDKVNALQNIAMDYETACRIRVYVKAVKDKYKDGELGAEMAAWIEWANKKADWFDPTISRKDELLGVREHEKNEEQKSFKNIGRYWW